MADNTDTRFYATAPFTGKAGKAAQEKLEAKAAEAEKHSDK